MRFMETPPAYSLDMTGGVDATFSESGAKDSDISGFLGRYIQIATLQWRKGVAVDTAIDPWLAWRNNAHIKKKVENFAYLKMDMEVKFVVNGTPFHYGQLMAAYAPMLSYWGQQFNDSGVCNTEKNKSSLYNFRHYINDAVHLKETTDSYFSTFPHVLISPGANETKEMVLPFVWHNNYLRTTATSTYSDGTLDLESPGSIVLRDLVDLAVASDNASLSVEVTIWARAKNVDLNTPTYATLASEVQRGGFISKIATGVASTARAAAAIPGVKPYAKATEVAATSLGSLAQLFGFSRPIDPTPSAAMSLNNAKNIAVTNTSDNSQKLAFDVNQEVTVDSRVIGLDGTDDMCFTNLNQKWWWCGRAPWTPTATAGGEESFGFNATSPELLYSALVSPIVWRHISTTHTASKHGWQLNPAGYIANTFNFWRGSITYRVQVVASQMHTGRIMLQFDPASAGYVTNPIEVRYTWILDLGEAREIEVTIPFTSYRSYLNCQSLGSYPTQNPEWSTSTAYTQNANFDPKYHMGVFSVSVVNDLVSPNGVDGKVYLSVWQRSESDTEFNCPDEEWSANIIRATGSGDFVPNDEEQGEHVGGPHDAKPMWITAPTPERVSVFCGEKVSSIRSLVKRFSYARTLTHNTANNGLRICTANIPHWPQVSQSAWDLKNSYTSYFMPAFLAKRGGTRKKIYFWVGGDSSTGNPTNSSFYSSAVNVDRRYSETHIPYNITDDAVADTTGVLYNNHVAGGYAGGMLAGANLGEGLQEVESPYYQNVRFQLGLFIGDSLSPIDPGDNYIRATRVNNMNTAWNARCSIYEAAADDMSLMWFLAAPVLYENH
jgi:hypothetical protein